VTDPIAEALDEFVPSFGTVDENWRGILVAAAVPPRPARRSRRRRVLLAVALFATVAVATAAVAAGLGAFNGIEAAQHPIGTADIPDPTTAAYVQSHLAGIQLDTTRHIAQLPDGQDVYVITGTQNDLCVVIGPPQVEASCGDPLSDVHPATIETYPISNDAGTKVVSWIVFGVALDGVSSVSFQSTQASSGEPSGPEITVPVSDNLWVWPTDQGTPPTALQQVTAHFEDGTSVVEPATGKNCAAC
jgi:hypothetical protein